MVWTTRMRGILIDSPERSCGVSMGLSRELPGRSPSWAGAKLLHSNQPAATSRSRPAKGTMRLLMMGSALCCHFPTESHRYRDEPRMERDGAIGSSFGLARTFVSGDGFLFLL